MYFTLRLNLKTRISKTRFDSRLKYCVTRSWLYIVVELLIGVKLTIFCFVTILSFKKLSIHAL